MEVEYSLTPEDILAFARFRLRQPKARPAARWPLYVFCGLLLLYVFFASRGGPGDPAPGFGPGLCVGVASTAVLFALLKPAVRRSQKPYVEDPRNQWLFATQRVTISPEGLTATAWLHSATSRWEVVWDVGVTAEHVFFCTTSLTAHIVPRRAFRGQQEFDDFVALARHYRQGAPSSDGIMEALPADAPPRSTTITRPPSN